MLIYDTNVLIQVVPNLKLAQQFLLDRFFPNIITSDTEKVSIDIDIGKRRRAPFVSPLVEGKLVEQRRYQTNEFTPAYIKDKRAPDLLKPVRRMIGERIGGELTGEEREMANLYAEMADQVDVLNRTLEWMAAQVMSTAQLTVEGDGFEQVQIDFGRDPSLTIALAGNAQWTAANITAGNASPTANVEAWQRAVLKSSGAKCSDIVFTTSSWDGFKLDPKLAGAIIYPVWNPNGNVVNPGAKIEQGAVWMGKWGQYDLWVYNDWYVDDNNVELPMLTDGTVIMSGPNLMGTRAFGMIKDPAFNYKALPYAPKTWVQEDPAQRYILMQSAPLVIPSRVNASLSATVCAPVYD
ncbi:major capsid protein [Trinickia dinghuensis]|uniref:Major capsid protein n=1 Tax=Trinickia dinghuensis TaxID=2291023 RepID=A0A3D8K2V6_9BURK|nr:major capsid protein [Trinickia dinghuensis]RDU99226.1 major capsid protein [Trinickia dinghuensis]